MEGYYIVLFKSVSVVAYRRKLGGEKGEGPVSHSGYFEGDSDVNIEGVGPGEGDPMVTSSVSSYRKI